MVQKVLSAGVLGIDGKIVVTEVDSHDGLPDFKMVGVLSMEVREAEDRVRTALKNSGFYLPPKKTTINLSPADLRKEGTGYDLPIAIGILLAYELLDTELLTRSMVIGELGLDGEVKPVHGILSCVTAAKEAGLERCFLPRGNALEGSVVDGIQIVPVDSLLDLFELLKDSQKLQKRIQKPFSKEGWFDLEKQTYDLDYREVNGQAVLKRATEIAVAGKHNILYIGSAGTGKTMVARRIPTIMPPMTLDETIEISKIYSICGLLSENEPVLRRRPFRSPHHTISESALAGGGMHPRPGEISLASSGVLFLDELPEFSAKTIEVLRQPMEDRVVTISRVHGACTFPANAMIAASANPCPCGFYPDLSRCHCSEAQIKRYLGKISKPILDRIDICIEAAPVSYEDLRMKGKGEDSASIRARVIKAQEIQRNRFQNGIYFNGEMGTKEVEEFCALIPSDEAFLKNVFEKKGLSARACHKILKVARTIADLDGKEKINRAHLCEAVGYRSLEDKFWK